MLSDLLMWVVATNSLTVQFLYFHFVLLSKSLVYQESRVFNAVIKQEVEMYLTLTQKQKPFSPSLTSLWLLILLQTETVEFVEWAEKNKRWTPRPLNRKYISTFPLARGARKLVRAVNCVITSIKFHNNFCCSADSDTSLQSVRFPHPVTENLTRK